MLENIPWNQTGQFVVFDYETSGLHRDDGAYPSTLGVKWGPTPAEQACIPVDQGMLDKPGTNPTLFGDAPNVTIEEWAEVHRWLAKQYLVAHNAKADLWFAWCGLRLDRNARYDLSERYRWDTMVVESLLNPGERVGIAMVAKRNGWAEDRWEEADQAMRKWTKRHKLGGDVRYDLAPWDVLEPYLSADLERTWLLYRQQRELRHHGELPSDLVQRELDLVRTLFRMERRGLPYRVQDSLEAAERAKIERVEIERELPFNPHTKAQVADYLKSHGVPVGKTDTGKPRLDQATVQKAIDLGVDHMARYQRWAKLGTAESLWYRGWAEKAGADGRIRADYRQVKTHEGGSAGGTVSGRFAVSRVQVQAIPNRYQVPEGYPAMQELISGDVQVWEADISQAEMRVVAVLSRCKPMLDGFRQGFDAHDSTTQLIWGIDKDHPEWKRRRAVAKRLGFGVIYGAGIRTLREQIELFTGEDLGEQGVRQLWDQYRQAFPQLFQYNRECQRQVKRRGYLVMIGGKRRVFQHWEPEHKAMNQMIQGSVAVGMVESMLEIDRRTPGAMIGQVHDSVIFETDDETEVYQICNAIEQTFERLFPGCPFPVEADRYDTK